MDYFENYLTESYSVNDPSIIPSIAALENGQWLAAEGMAYSNYKARAFELEREAM